MADEGQLHIVMFPWLAFGHIIPYFELANLIAQKGHKVSFIITPRNFKRLPKLPSILHIVELPLPKTEGLPDTAEATIDLPGDKVQYLMKAFDGLKEPVTQFLQTSNPDWIVLDFAPYWLPPIAANLSISTAVLSIYPAASVCFSGTLNRLSDRTEPEHFTVAPNWVPFPSSVKYKLFEIRRTFDLFRDNVTDIPDVTRFLTTFSGCDIIAIRSSFEYEPEWISLLQQLQEKPVIPVGLLPKKIDSDEVKDDSWMAIKNWLDKQVKGSVVYIAFGSESTPTQDEFAKLADGLELSGLPFFWVLRGGELPQGFTERTKDQGLIWTSWAPQFRILAHDSIGVFLTHCGLSSAFEALQMGRPLILFPLLIDQALIARVLEGKKLGYSVPRDDTDGSFTSESVAHSLKLVMAEEGEIYREKAKEISRILADHQLHDRYVNDFLNYLKEHKKRAP